MSLSLTPLVRRANAHLTLPANAHLTRPANAHLTRPARPLTRSARRLVSSPFFALAIISQFSWSLYMFFLLVKGGKKLTTATSSTLIMTCMCQLFLFLWLLNYIITPSSEDLDHWNLFYDTVFIPGTACFGAISSLNMSLMWAQIVDSSKNLKSSGSNLNSKMRKAVIGFSFFFMFVNVVCFGLIPSLKFIGMLLDLFFVTAIGISYRVGGFRIAQLIKKGGNAQKAEVIRQVSLKVFYALTILFPIGTIMYAGGGIIAGGCTDPRYPGKCAWIGPFMIIGVQFGMITSLLAVEYTVLRFIWNSQFAPKRKVHKSLWARRGRRRGGGGGVGRAGEALTEEHMYIVVSRALLTLPRRCAPSYASSRSKTPLALRVPEGPPRMVPQRRERQRGQQREQQRATAQLRAAVPRKATPRRATRR